LPRYRSFGDITLNAERRDLLQQAYATVNDVELWIGGLTEDPFEGSMLGQTFTHIIKEQFEALRDGDEHWYQQKLDQREITEVESTSLADIIRRNSSIGSELPDNVFRQ